MIQVSVNSQSHYLPDQTSLNQLLERLRMSTLQGMAVAINDEVIPKSRWQEYLLGQSDKVLIIKASQGG